MVLGDAEASAATQSLAQLTQQRPELFRCVKAAVLHQWRCEAGDAVVSLRAAMLKAMTTAHRLATQTGQ